jgi:peptide/nickel transport system substrate-binding protein
MCPRFIAACLAAGLAASVLSGAAAAQTLRIAINNDPDGLDPGFSRTFVGTVVLTGLCDKLVDFDTHLNIVPGLATSYEWVDSKTVLFHLRPGVLFQDGTRMDAAAVKYTLDRDLDAPGSFRRSEVGAMDHVEIVDPLTVRVVLKQPSSPFVAALTDRAGMIISPKAARAEGKDFPLHPVCAGPFKFHERVAQDHITLDRFKRYWNANAVHFDHVIYRPMTDSSIRLSNLQAGSVDLADIVPTDVATVRSNHNLAISISPGIGYAALTINLAADTPLAHDPRIRQAIDLSIDRAALIQVVYSGMYTPDAQATAASSPMYDPAVKPPIRDVAAAHALLVAAGVKLPLHIRLTVANNPQSIQVAEVLQSMLRDAGIELEVNNMDFGTSLALIQGGNYAMALGGWSGLLDPDSNLWSFLHSGGPLNVSRYDNPKADAALDQARLTTDIPKRRAAYAALWQQERHDLPIIYLYTPAYINGYSRKLTGFETYPDGLLRLQGVSLTK